MNSSDLRRLWNDGNHRELNKALRQNVESILDVLDAATTTAKLVEVSGYRGLGVLRLKAAVAKFEGRAIIQSPDERRTDG